MVKLDRAGLVFGALIMVCGLLAAGCSGGASPTQSSNSCPSGTTGTYPNCTAITCPTGTTGTYPNCVATNVCPSGTTGTYPNCTAITCPTGTTGTYPNCTNTGKTFVALDPLLSDQWHLKNTGQAGTNGTAGVAGEDINVTPVWTNYRGAGIRIAVIDDGMDIKHEDLAGNVVSGGSHNYCNGGTDPTSCPANGAGCNGGDSCHGTQVSGLAAAMSNTVGGLGAAPEASLVGFNVLQSSAMSDFADATTRDLSKNHIYTNSWGAPDGSGMYFPPDSTWTAAIESGTSTGRGGKGAIYTWANGNGGGTGVCTADRSDYDGQANYHGVFAITALDDRGKQADYSEAGSNVLVSSYGGEFCDPSYAGDSGHGSHALTTTDMTGSLGANSGGFNTEFNVADYSNPNYTKCMNGTSGATPLAAGVIALVLQANPTLSWRDVRIILAQSARKNDASDFDWTTNGAGLHVNHKYGYGVLDANAAVNLATTWTNVGTAQSFSPQAAPNAAIPDFGLPVTSSITVSNSGITSVEFVDLNITTNHPSVGDLLITLTSPQGTVSTVSVQHTCYALNSTGSSCNGPSVPSCGCIDGSTSCSSGASWRYGVARLLNEKANGVWTLSVQDQVKGNSGTLQSWGLTIFGR